MTVNQVVGVDDRVNGNEARPCCLEHAKAYHCGLQKSNSFEKRSEVAEPENIVPFEYVPMMKVWRNIYRKYSGYDEGPFEYVLSFEGMIVAMFVSLAIVRLSCRNRDAHR